MTSTDTSAPAHASGMFQIGGKTIHRLGYGAMRITGEGIWGPPADHEGALAVVRRAVELGVDFIDTADSYGPYVSEDLLAEALAPYPEQVLIATKAGLLRHGPNKWISLGHPAYLRQEAEMSLRRLKLGRLELLQLHRVDPNYPLADQVGELKALQDEGKVGSVGLSNVSVDQLTEARGITEIVTVQNRYNLTDRSSQDVLDYCTQNGVGFIPWAPVAAGDLAASGGPVDDVEKATGATASQVSLAWLLAISPIVLPIPGTASIAHLEENVAAASVSLTPAQVEKLTSAT
ncbi:MAG: aldo/keto reductase [bacterium]